MKIAITLIVVYFIGMFGSSIWFAVCDYKPIAHVYDPEGYLAAQESKDVASWCLRSSIWPIIVPVTLIINVWVTIAVLIMRRIHEKKEWHYWYKPTKKNKEE